MRYILIMFALLMALPVQAFAGNCRYDSDTAADGSRCGERSSESREGGE